MHRCCINLYVCLSGFRADLLLLPAAVVGVGLLASGLVEVARQSCCSWLFLRCSPLQISWKVRCGEAIARLAYCQESADDSVCVIVFKDQCR